MYHRAALPLNSWHLKAGYAIWLKYQMVDYFCFEYKTFIIVAQVDLGLSYILTWKMSKALPEQLGKAYWIMFSPFATKEAYVHTKSFTLGKKKLP